MASTLPPPLLGPSQHQPPPLPFPHGHALPHHPELNPLSLPLPPSTHACSLPLGTCAVHAVLWQHQRGGRGPGRRLHLPSPGCHRHRQRRRYWPSRWARPAQAAHTGAGAPPLQPDAPPRSTCKTRMASWRLPPVAPQRSPPPFSMFFDVPAASEMHFCVPPSPWGPPSS